MRIPKYIKDLVENGELSHSQTNMKGFERYTFRLYARNGTEDWKPRSIEATIELAQKITDWASKSGALAKIGEKDWLWWNPYDRYWEELPYVYIGLTDPIGPVLEKEIKEAKRTRKDEGSFEEENVQLVMGRDIQERSWLKLLNRSLEGFSAADSADQLIGHYRADHDRYRWHYTWWDEHRELKTEDVRAELEEIGTQVIFKMFPGGVSTMERYCDEMNAERVGNDSANMYYSGKLCNYWIRFIFGQGNYNICATCS